VKHANRLLKKFEASWWFGDAANSYADSLDDPDADHPDTPQNTKVFQRHWIGLTPTEAVLPSLPGRASAPLASRSHGITTLDQHEQPCYTGEFGLYHTGTGPTSASTGNPGASCDSALSTVTSERTIFTLNSAIAAVSEGNYGRLAASQQGLYTSGNAKVQLDPSVWEMPGMMPEITPSPDFGANIEKKLTERSMVMQAWGAYGVLWPVIHQWLGVSPDMGRGKVSVVAQVPAGQTTIAGKKIRVGTSSIDVSSAHRGSSYATIVNRHARMKLTIGIVLPAGSQIQIAALNGQPVTPKLVRTTRGLEARVTVPAGKGQTLLGIQTTTS
jgi:hypothetical protein